MFFFKYNASKHIQPTVESKLKGKCCVLLFRCAAYLQLRANSLSFRTLRCFLFVFCLLSACICGWIIVSSFRQKDAGELKVTPIRLPVQVFESGAENDTTRNLTKNTWLQVQAWHHVLDSLRGRVLYDRFRSSLNTQLNSLHHTDTPNHLQQRTKPK